MLNALIAGVLSPMVSGSGVSLAIAGLAFVVVGWAFWRWEAARSWQAPTTPDAPAIEPPETL